jgi:uncharacterized protein
LKELKQKLLLTRKKRSSPLKDDKVITAWNGLAIYAFAEAGRTFLNESYLQIAEQAARFIKDNLWKGGVLYRRWRDGEARFEGCLDDYACMIHASISLFEADLGAEWLEFALMLASVLESEFKAENGSFYLTNGKDTNLILRRSEFYDGAEPSGNAVHTENLVRLYQITGAHEYLQQAEDILKAAKQHIDTYPPSASYHLMALMRYLDNDAPAMVVSLNENEQYKEEIAKMIGTYFIPNKVVIYRRQRDEELRDFVPWSHDKEPIEDKTTLYICRKGQCLEPMTDIPKMWESIEKC